MYSITTKDSSNHRVVYDYHDQFIDDVKDDVLRELDNLNGGLIDAIEITWKNE